MSEERPQERRWQSGAAFRRDIRLEVVRYGLLVFALVIVFRLVSLQLFDYDLYQALASGQHEIFQSLFPIRGEILAHDLKDGSLVPLATNEQLTFVFADPRQVKDPVAVGEALAKAFGYDDETTIKLTARLMQKDDPFEPIEHNVSDDVVSRLKALSLSGIQFVRETNRLYPEEGVGGHVLGFLGSDEDGKRSGKYGIEGFFNEELAGKQGYVKSERDLSGRLIALGKRDVERAVDGSTVVLTIDRNIQFMACAALRRAIARHGADGGSVVIVEPSTGRILAMCGDPDFDPNRYREAKDLTVFNNPAIFQPYEPGSIFKPITMAAALDVGAVEPTTMYEDTGSVKVDDRTIRNSDGAAHGIQDMTGVLEESLNTGLVFVMRKAGKETFAEYVKKFGFGERTGVELETEAPGDVSALAKKGEIFSATASFGQGISVTPLQMAMAFAAIANGGILKKPMIVDEIRHPDGSVETQTPTDIRRVIETKTSRLLGAMLISVIEHGHGRRASVPGYYIAGKTGTAQVAKKDGVGYEEGVTIGSFAGFGPVDDPKFAMVVRIDRPKDVSWAESSAAPLFGEIASYILQYLEVPPTR